MRILFVSTMNRYPWGGSEELWSQAALLLHKQGHDVSASLLSWNPPSPRVKELEDVGIKVRFRPKSGWPPIASYKAVRKILPKFAEWLGTKLITHDMHFNNHDVICINNGWVVDDFKILRAAVLSDAKVVNLSQANGVFFWPNDDLTNQLVELNGMVKHWCFVSQTNKQLFETQIGIQLKNSKLVKNPAKLFRPAPTDWPVGGTTISAACVARLEPQIKGQDLLCHILAQPKWRNRSIKLSLFGQGQNKESLIRLIQTLGLNASIQVFDQIDDISKVWRTHHAMVLPSRMEGTPLAVIEAMLHSRPVVATDVGGTSDLVMEGESGFLAKSATLDELDSALERMWTHRERLCSIGKSARKIAENYLSSDPIEDFAKILIDCHHNR